jgi:hypothetical protein
MSNPAFDFSNLSPEERLRLAEDLRNSLPASPGPLSAAEIEAIRVRYMAENYPDPSWEDSAPE